MNNLSPKVTWPALAGAVVTLLVAIAASAGIELEPAVQSALQTVVTAVLGYVVTDPLRNPPQ